MAETMTKLIIDVAGKEYEIAAGGGVPGPDSVGTVQIIDGSVEMEDLNGEVRDRLVNTYDSDNRTLYINGAKPKQTEG